MKKVSYQIEEETMRSVTIRVEGEASKVCAMSCFTGFNLKDAIRNANKRLNLFGFEVQDMKLISYGDYERYAQERLYLFNSREEMDMAFMKMFNLTDVQFAELMEQGFTYDTINS